MSKLKISTATIARTAALLLALTNQILSSTGHAVLPIESEQLEQGVTLAITVGASLAAWWKNNSFTQPALQADAQLETLRSIAADKKF